MQAWTSHNPMRNALILADGPAVMFELMGCEHLNDGLPGIDDLRNSTSRTVMAKGDKSPLHMACWADWIADLLQMHGGGNRRIAIDKLAVAHDATIPGRRVRCGLHGHRSFERAARPVGAGPVTRSEFRASSTPARARIPELCRSLHLRVS